MIYGWDARKMQVAIALIAIGITCCILSLIFALVGSVISVPLSVWFGCSSLATGVLGLVSAVWGTIGYCIEYTENR